MKGMVNLCLVLAAVSFIIGILSRMTSVPVGPINIQARAFLQLTNTWLLLAVVFMLKAKA